MRDDTNVTSNALVYILPRQKWIACDLVSGARVYLSLERTYYEVESFWLQ